MQYSGKSAVIFTLRFAFTHASFTTPAVNMFLILLYYPLLIQAIYPTHSHTRLSAQPSAASTIWTGGSSACTSPAITKIATTRCGLILPHLHRFCRTFTCLRVAHSYFFVNELCHIAVIREDYNALRRREAGSRTVHSPLFVTLSTD